MDLSFTLSLDKGESGISFYMDENHHYDLAITKDGNDYYALLRLCIGNIKTIVKSVSISSMTDLVKAKLQVTSDSQTYHFYLVSEETRIELGQGLSRYLSSEVAGGFTGVVMGLYAICQTNDSQASFTDFNLKYV